MLRAEVPLATLDSTSHKKRYAYRDAQRVIPCQRLTRSVCSVARQLVALHPSTTPGGCSTCSLGWRSGAVFGCWLRTSIERRRSRDEVAEECRTSHSSDDGAPLYAPRVDQQPVYRPVTCERSTVFPAHVTNTLRYRPVGRSKTSFTAAVTGTLPSGSRRTAGPMNGAQPMSGAPGLSSSQE